jgi:hypothetical protein
MLPHCDKPENGGLAGIRFTFAMGRHDLRRK